jgi:hypothetical protein
MSFSTVVFSPVNMLTLTLCFPILGHKIWNLHHYQCTNDVGAKKSTHLKLCVASMQQPSAFVMLRDHQRDTGLFIGPVLDVGESYLLYVPPFVWKHAEGRYATLQ